MMNVTKVIEGVDVERYCVISRIGVLPVPDSMLMVKLLLENHTEYFFSVANKFEVPRPIRASALDPLPAN